MHTQTRKTTVTFSRPFQMDGFEEELPAGVYEVESEYDILDGLFLPDCRRTSVLIHLQSNSGSSGYAQTLTVPWLDLEAALVRDRLPAMSTANPGLEEILLDPIIRKLMRSDDVSEAEIRDLVSGPPKRTRAPVDSEQ